LQTTVLYFLEVQNSSRVDVRNKQIGLNRY
jgi:hypothetical protein